MSHVKSFHRDIPTMCTFRRSDCNFLSLLFCVCVARCSTHDRFFFVALLLLSTSSAMINEDAHEADTMWMCCVCRRKHAAYAFTTTRSERFHILGTSKTRTEIYREKKKNFFWTGKKFLWVLTMKKKSLLRWQSAGGRRKKNAIKQSRQFAVAKLVSSSFHFTHVAPDFPISGYFLFAVLEWWHASTIFLPHNNNEASNFCPFSSCTRGGGDSILFSIWQRWLCSYMFWCFNWDARLHACCEISYGNYVRW